jgi:hypothetical protein
MSGSVGKEEYNDLLKACESLTKFRDHRMYDYISILFNTVVDFQLDTKVVINAKVHYKNNHWNEIRTHADLKRILSEYPNTKKSNTLLAEYLWGYKLWSRAKFLRELVKFFEAENVRGFKSLSRWIKNAEYSDVEGKIQVRDTANGRVIHSIGPVLFEWLRLRLGEDTIKVDVHIQNFVKKEIGHLPNDEVIRTTLIKIAEKMKKKPRELDAAIWHHMRKHSQ